MARRPVRVAYAVELGDAIANLAHSARLSETVPAHGNARWTPEKLLASCLLMSWHEGQTLTSRFPRIRHRPDWQSWSAGQPDTACAASPRATACRSSMADRRLDRLCSRWFPL